MKLSSLSDEIAIIKTKLRTKPSPSIDNSQQRQEYRETETAERVSERNRKIQRNSPHSKRSLHNYPPREVRNIIPEPPTQNMPALPQNSSPLVRQHQSHSCNKKFRSHIQARTLNGKLITKPLYRKYLRI